MGALLGRHLPVSSWRAFNQSPSSRPEAKSTRMEATATHSRVKTASKWKKADRRSRWATKPKKREPYPKEATPSPRPKVSYSPSRVADENGFQASGDHLPTPPPMPAHVIKLLTDL